MNADDALTMPVRGADERCISFGVDVGDYHLNRQQGETWLRVKGEKVLNVKEMPLTGQHNYSNALAALALAMPQVAAGQQPEGADHLYRSGAPFPVGAGTQRRTLD